MFLRLNQPSSDCSKRGHRRQRHVRPAHLLRRLQVLRRGIGVVRPRVELEPRVRGGHELREAARRVSVGHACDLAIASVGGRLPDCDLRAGVAGLDPRVRSGIEARVVARPDRAALAVELRRQEELQVRLVPDRVEADEGIALVAARVALRERAGERRQVAELRRHVVRLLAAVRPLRRAPDRDQHLHAAQLRVAHELVEIVELVVRVERVGGVGRPRRSDVRPGHERADDRRVRIPRLVEDDVPVLLVPEVGIVVEADVHALRRRREGRHEQGGGRGHEQKLNESSHEDMSPLAF